MRLANFVLGAVVVTLSLGTARTAQGAVVSLTPTGLSVTLTALDLGTPIPLPDPADPGVPLTVAGPFDIVIFNDTGGTLDFAELTFTVPPIAPAPAALAIASPDLGLDPPFGPGVFDLAAAGPGTYVVTMGMDTGIADDADAIPDGTFLILYSGAGPVEFSGVSLLALPEPGSTVLMGLAAGGLLLRRRNRRG